MSQLDNFFKDKLNDRNFEFKDAYWEDAERLIEAQEEDDRRRRFGWWWKIGLFLLVFSLAGYFTFNEWSKAAIPNTNTITKVEQKEETKVTLAPSKKEILSTKTPEDVSTTITNKIKEQNTTNTYNTSKTDNSSTNNSKPSQKQFPQSTISTAQTLNNNDVIAPRPKVIEQDSGNDQKLLTLPLPLESSEENLLVDSMASKKRKMALNDQGDLKALEDNSIAEEREDIMEALLPLETIAFEVDANTKPDCNNCIKLTKPFKPKRLSLGVALESILYPFEEDEDWFIGGALGLTANYRLNRKLAIRSGLQYAVYSGPSPNFFISPSTAGVAPVALSDFEAFDFTIENQYGFGLKTIQTIYPPENFHTLEIPMMLQFHHNRSAFEAGVYLNFLVALQAKEIKQSSQLPWEDDNNSNNIEISERKKWVATNDYAKVSASLALGYRYAFSPKLALTCNAFYKVGNEDAFNNKTLDDFANIAAENAVNNTFTPQRLQLRIGMAWNLSK